MTRGQRGRRLAKFELLITAVLCFVFAPFLYVAAPAGIEPMFSGPGWPRAVLAGIGVVGILVGFAWMIRIYRADPEPDQRSWRYRQDD